MCYVDEESMLADTELRLKFSVFAVIGLILHR